MNYFLNITSVVYPQYTNPPQDYMVQTNQIDDFVYQTINDHQNTILSFDNYQDIYNYSINVENLLSSSDASPEEMQILLSAFAVGRYSAGFWINSQI